MYIMMKSDIYFKIFNVQIFVSDYSFCWNISYKLTENDFWLNIEALKS